MSRFSKIISDLKDLHQQDIKDTAKVFAITATLAERLQELLNDLDPEKVAAPTETLASGDLTKEDLIARYGSYNNAYRAYKEAYNIKGVKGWDGLTRAIRGLQAPSSSPSLERRVEKLEETVKILAELWLDNERSSR